VDRPCGLKKPVLPLLLLAFLSACATRPGMAVLEPLPDAPPPGKSVTALVATTRERQSPGRNDFTNGRSHRLNFAEFTISLPPAHRPGRIEWPQGEPDPERDFVTRAQRVLTQEDFGQTLRARGCGEPGGLTTVFVHGFNTSFPEALFRVAQMAADAAPNSIPVLFAWPSDASPLAYVADRDSAQFSRDHLAELLTRLAGLCRGGRIVLVGHSMGGWLTVEALRQLRMMGRDEVLGALSVMLASPDIDSDVFRIQMRQIGPMDPPVTVLVSPDDRALSVSARLSGTRPRAGSLDVTDANVQEAAREAQLAIVDISRAEASDVLNHDRYVDFASSYARLSAADQAAQRERPGLRRAGAYVFNALGAVVSSPFTLVSRVLSPD